MSLDADLIVDRRRMRRKLTFWRVLAVLVAIVGDCRRDGDRDAARRHRLASGSDYIARIKITGLIRNDQERVDALERLAQVEARRP